MKKKTHLIIGSSQVGLLRQALVEGFKLPYLGSRESLYVSGELIVSSINSSLTDYDCNLLYSSGPPIWSARHYLDLIKKHYETFSGNIFLIFPDFRFRNQMFFEMGFDKDSDLFVEHSKMQTWANKFGEIKPNIVKDFMSPEKDKILYERGLACLDYLLSKFGDRIKLIFWELFAGEYSNKLRGKYTKNGVYKHPTWNYPEVMEKYKDYAIDVSEVASEKFEIPPKLFDNLSLQLARCNSFYQGDGRHFSTPKGTIFLDYLVHLLDAKKAVAETEKFMEENREDIERNMEKMKKLKWVSGKLVPREQTSYWRVKGLQ